MERPFFPAAVNPRAPLLFAKTQEYLNPRYFCHFWLAASCPITSDTYTSSCRAPNVCNDSYIDGPACRTGATGRGGASYPRASSSAALQGAMEGGFRPGVAVAAAAAAAELVSCCQGAGVAVLASAVAARGLDLSAAAVVGASASAAAVVSAAAVGWK